MLKFISIIFCLATLIPADHAMIKSAIMPGWGEYSLNQPERAKGFFIRESLIWLTYLGGNKIHSWYQDDYYAFAGQHAGVSLVDKSYQFGVDIGNYDNFYAYNSAKDRRREVELKYPEGEGYEWQWDSTENRYKFDDMRIVSATGKKVASFAIAAMLVHRAISLFDVLYLKRKDNPIHLSSSFLPKGNRTLQLQISVCF